MCSLEGAEGPNMRGQAMSSSSPEPARSQGRELERRHGVERDQCVEP
jgi:hypothetical protein